MAKKSTNYEIIQRVTKVIDFLLDGLSRYEIQQYATEKWNLTTRPVDKYIAYANKRIERMAGKAEERAFDKIRARLERQYRRSIQDKDGRLTLAIIDKMCKLYGLDKPIKIAPTTPDGKALESKTEITFITGQLQGKSPKERRELYKILENVNGKE